MVLAVADGDQTALHPLMTIEKKLQTSSRADMAAVLLLSPTSCY